MEFWEMWPPEEHERLIENMSAWMDGELPDIASTPEAGGPDDLELEVAEHQACCPSCRDLFEELKELRARRSRSQTPLRASPRACWTASGRRRSPG